MQKRLLSSSALIRRHFTSSTSSTTTITRTSTRDNNDHHHTYGVLTFKDDLQLHLPQPSGPAIIPAASLHVKYATWGNPSHPPILICPSMSNSPFVIDSYSDGDPQRQQQQEKNKNGIVNKGWWNHIVGAGQSFGIDITRFYVICGAALGAPFGTTSPLSINPATGKTWGPSFPQVTPRDMAVVQARMLKELGIRKVHAVIGGSMGGMQSLEFAANFPEMYDNFVAISATAHTAPSTVVLRSVQRSAVRMDPKYNNGLYEKGSGPDEGMALARKIGTIVYRSRKEFDIRFNWLPKENKKFEIEEYLEHQAHKFTRLVGYDANCYLLLSQAMDLMNIGDGFGSFGAGVGRIPSNKYGLLLSYDTDVLTPPQDLERVSSFLGRNHTSVHFETLHSKFGHDAFLIESEAPPLVYRLREFLDSPSPQLFSSSQSIPPNTTNIKNRNRNPVDRVRSVVKELHDN
jgi:homoserine O-acetyltransferase